MKKLTEKQKKVVLKRHELVTIVKQAIEDIVQFKGPSYEDTLEDLHGIKYDLELFIEGFEGDIRNRDSK